MQVEGPVGLEKCKNIYSGNRGRSPHIFLSLKGRVELAAEFSVGSRGSPYAGFSQTVLRERHLHNEFSILVNSGRILVSQSHVLC